MEQTPRFALPFLASGQAQKEWYHNEALQLVDFLLCPVIEQAASATPPANPAIGQCFVVGAGATGAWAGQDGKLAGFSEGGWRFIAPVDGVAVLVRSSGETMLRRAGVWESGVARVREVRVNGQAVLGDRQAAIAGPSGGAVVDVEARAAITGILAGLRAHGLIAP